MAPHIALTSEGVSPMLAKLLEKLRSEISELRKQIREAGSDEGGDEDQDNCACASCINKKIVEWMADNDLTDHLNINEAVDNCAVFCDLESKVSDIESLVSGQDSDELEARISTNETDISNLDDRVENVE